VFVLFFMIVTRVGRSIFYRKFVMLPRIDRERGLAETLRNIDIVASESGWVNPEKTAGSKQRSDESKVLFPARFAMWPYFEEDEINAAVSVLRSGRINRWTGEHGVLFEKEFAAFCKCTNAITVANGTVALELALQALGIGPGDEVIVPCRTFIATASSVVMRGATPVMADVDAESQVLTTETILPVLTPKTKAVIAVHLNGWPCDMDSIMEVARSHGIKVIEDCAHAHGAKYKDRPVGSLGDVAAFSFCQDKIMTTAGEGGMFTTNNTDIWKQAWGFKDHGKSYDTVYNKEHPPGFRWLHEGLGTNWRLTEIQSAIGRIMLKKLAFWVETRRRYAHHLTEAFSEIAALRVTNPPPEIYHSYYKYYAFVRPARLKQGWDRDRIINEITAEGIPCYTGICGQVHREKVFADTAYAPARELPVSKALMDTSLMFLVHPTLSESDIDTTIRVVKSVMARATWC
jgi:hypothetical protein